MTTEPCIACGQPIRAQASFCGHCGATRSPAVKTPTSTLRFEVDEALFPHFEVGARCLLRVRVANLGGLLVEKLSVHPSLHAGEALDSVTFGSIAPGAAESGALYLTPTDAGFHELHAVLGVVTAGHATYFRLTPVPFRVGAGGPQSVVVNLDQRSARVVDNSRLTVQAGTGGGGVAVASWRAVPLELISREDAAVLAPELLSVPPAATTVSRPAPVGAVSFSIRTATGTSYRVERGLATGDISTVYAGFEDGSGRAVAVKIADDPGDNDLIQSETNVLGQLRAVPSRQDKHLPVVLGQLRTADGRLGTVFERIDGLDLLTLRERLPAGIPAVHLVWILRRALSALGWAHSNGILHGNVDPAHVLVRAQDHNVWLVDWCWSIVRPTETGQGFRCLNEIYGPPEAASRRPPSPASDLYALGKTMIFAAGGDPATNALPATLDDRFQRLLRFMVQGSQRGRAQDAWQIYEQVDLLREAIFGPHQFTELVVPDGARP